MSIKKLFYPLIPLLIALMGCSKPSIREFAAFDNGLTDLPSIEAKADLLKELGYDGMTWRPGPGNTAEVLKILDGRGLKLYATYVVLKADPTSCPIPEQTVAEINALKGRETFIWLNINGETSDEIAVQAIREMADLGKTNGLKVALYPHTDCKTDTVANSLRLIEIANRENVGISFNLCHFLKQNDEASLEEAIRSTREKLMLVSINGSDGGDTQSMGWDRLIRPLGEGSFDSSKVMTLLDEIDYSGPILLQCYNIEQPASQHLATSMNAWKAMH